MTTPSNQIAVIPARELRCAMMFASDDPERPTRMSVWLDAGKYPVVVATDGWRMAVIRTEGEITESANIPAIAIKAALGDVGNSTLEQLCVSKSGDDLVLKRIAGEFSVTCKSAGNFPNWVSCVPTEPQVERVPFSVNPEAFASFSEARKALHLEQYSLIVNYRSELDAIEFRIGENFYGLLMPMRREEVDFKRPDWLPKPAKAKTDKEEKA